MFIDIIPFETDRTLNTKIDVNLTMKNYVYCDFEQEKRCEECFNEVLLTFN